MSAAASGAGVGAGETGDGLGGVEATELGMTGGVEAVVGVVREGDGVGLCAAPHAANSVTTRIKRIVTQRPVLRIALPPLPQHVGPLLHYTDARQAVKVPIKDQLQEAKP